MDMDGDCESRVTGGASAARGPILISASDFGDAFDEFASEQSAGPIRIISTGSLEENPFDLFPSEHDLMNVAAVHAQGRRISPGLALAAASVLIVIGLTLTASIMLPSSSDPLVAELMPVPTEAIAPAPDATALAPLEGRAFASQAQSPPSAVEDRREVPAMMPTTIATAATEALNHVTAPVPAVATAPATTVAETRVTTPPPSDLAVPRSALQANLVAESPIAPPPAAPASVTATPIEPPIQLRADAAPAAPPVASAPPPVTSAPPIVASAPPPAAAPLPAAAVQRVNDPNAIESVLGRYRTAFSALDASAAHAVWPKVNTRELGKAFSSLEEQQLEFDKCQIDVNGARAVASCGGRTRYVPKVGSKNSQTVSQRWTFNLQKVEDRWLIDTVDAR
jgi:hypothetical protein